MTHPSFRFKYKVVEGTSRTTGKPFVRHFPYMPCQLSTVVRTTAPTEGLLDSGSDGTVIPMELARYLGLELHKATPMQVVGRKGIERYTSKVTLTLGRAGRYGPPIEDIEVSVPADGDTPIILGRDPVFELYRITFVEAEKRFEMEPYSR